MVDRYKSGPGSSWARLPKKPSLVPRQRKHRTVGSRSVGTKILRKMESKLEGGPRPEDGGRQADDAAASCQGVKFRCSALRESKQCLIRGVG